MYLAANSFTYTSQHSLFFFVYGFIISFLFYLIHKVMTLIDNPPQNQVIFPSICFLSSIGLIFQYRLSPNGLAVIQARWLIIGLLSFLCTILVFRRHYRKLEEYKYSIGIFAVVLLLITIWQIIHLPSDVTVAPRIRIYKDFGFQASELVKLCYVIFLAGYMAEYHGYFLFAQYKKIGVINFLTFFRATIIISIILACLFVVDKRCRDIGPLPVLFGALLTINYAANKKWTHVLIGLAVFIRLSGRRYAN